MLHELDRIEAGPPPTPGADWAEIRLWRKVKRATLIARRAAMPDEDRAAHSAAITAALADLLAPHAGVVGCYWPVRGEYDPRELMRLLHGRGMRLALPMVAERAKPLVFRTWRPGDKLAPGLWNIPVPAAGDPVSPDALLVPLVGFDRRGYRLGYGGGYYDRTLSAYAAKPLAVGVGFESAGIATIFPQPHDVPMDLIVTQGRIVRRRGG